MSDPQSYPSPNAAQMAAGAAGLYAHPNGSLSPPQEQSNPVDPHLSLQNDNSLQTGLHDQLAAHLSRSINEAPMAGTPQNQQSHVPMAHHNIQQVQPPQPNQRHHEIMGIAQDVMNVARDAHYPPHQDNNLRKRSKVSRACDECRRKKIRCDATSENGPEACTSCKRTGARCQFSRQPQKRGPSKGYIKELADRLSRLEYEAQQQQGQSPQNGQLHQQQAELQSYLQNFSDQGMAGVPDFSNSTGAAQATTGRKRTHSVSEGIGEQLRSHMQSANGTQQSWDRRESSFGAFEQDSAVEMFQLGNSADVAVGEYYRVIQETYPILPFDQRNLKTRLVECDAKLREGFLAAIDCAVRAWPCTNLSKEANHLDRCFKTYNLLNLEVGVPLNKSSGIILAQSYLLLAIESETQGPTQRDLQASSLKDLCIASAARVAGNFSLNTMCYRNRPQEVIPDSDDALGRRVFWVTFILDFFHAISTCSEPSISEERNFLSIEDENIFGTVIFSLARLSKIISNISLLAKFTKDVGSSSSSSSSDAWTPHTPSSFAFKVIRVSINGQIERFHETLPLEPHPLVLLAYWYTRLLIARYGPGPESSELLTCANCITNLLQTHIVFLTPPYHHFAALTALVLGELAEKVESHDEALRILGELESALHRTKTDDDAAWDSTIRFYVSKKRASVQTEPAAGNSTTLLEHLAEAAVGERQGPGAGVSTTSPDDPKDVAGGGALSTGENRVVSNGNEGENTTNANENGTGDHPAATGTVVADDKKDDIANAAAAAAAAAAATAAAALNQSLYFNPALMVRDGYLRVLVGVVMPVLQPGHGGAQ